MQDAFAQLIALRVLFEATRRAFIPALQRGSTRAEQDEYGRQAVRLEVGHNFDVVEMFLHTKQVPVRTNGGATLVEKILSTRVVFRERVEYFVSSFVLHIYYPEHPLVRFIREEGNRVREHHMTPDLGSFVTYELEAPGVLSLFAYSTAAQNLRLIEKGKPYLHLRSLMFDTLVMDFDSCSGLLIRGEFVRRFLEWKERKEHRRSG